MDSNGHHPLRLIPIVLLGPFSWSYRTRWSSISNFPSEAHTDFGTIKLELPYKVDFITSEAHIDNAELWMIKHELPYKVESICSDIRTICCTRALW